MKKYIKHFFLIGIVSFSSISCSDYLSEGPDNVDTMDQVFQRKESTLKFLGNVYSYIRPMYKWSNESIWTGVSDELDVTYPDYDISKINLGAVAPDKEGRTYGNYWTHYYAGIRAATYFMNRVDECSELEGTVLLPSGESVISDLRPRSKAEARALRAWYYFSLIRQYGPVVILSEELVPAGAPVSEMQEARTPIKESFEYVVNELDSVLLMNVLPKSNGGFVANDYGRMTEVLCKAIQARALLYASSDFFNGDRTRQAFKEFKNVDGKSMFNTTDADRLKSLEKAKQITLDVIKNYSLKLYKVADASGAIDPYKSYQHLFIKGHKDGEEGEVDWKKEVIYAMPKGDFWEQDKACSPRFVNGWSGWGATQEVVDAYFTKTGYPLLKDAAGNMYAEDGSYTETGFSSGPGDNGYTQRNTYKMYTNREPRFYISICFNNSKWLSVHNQSTVELFYGGNTGRTDKEERNYSQTGYLARKFVNPESNVSLGNTQDRIAILFRLGEYYLNYAEILNELNYSGNRTEILTYLNQIRERAGIPIYGTNKAIGEIPIPATYEDMKDAIRRERRVELAFEEHRYFDCIRWGIADKEFDGAKHGMNVNDSKGAEAFHKRTAFETRKFPERNLLWPIPQSDMYKGKKLVQNPGWSSVKSPEL